MNKKPKRLLLKKSQLKELKKRIAQRSLDDKDWDILDGMADTIDFLYMVLVKMPPGSPSSIPH